MAGLIRGALPCAAPVNGIYSGDASDRSRLRGSVLAATHFTLLQTHFLQSRPLYFHRWTPRVHQVLLFHGNAKVQCPRPTRITNKSFGGMGLLPRLERWCLLPNRISHCLIRSPNTEMHRIGEIRAKLLLRGPRGSSTTRLGAPKRRTTSTFSL
jgi:hypothetical protein